MSFRDRLGSKVYIIDDVNNVLVVDSTNQRIGINTDAGYAWLSRVPFHRQPIGGTNLFVDAGTRVDRNHSPLSRATFSPWTVTPTSVAPRKP